MKTYALVRVTTPDTPESNVFNEKKNTDVTKQQK